jgi:hypothetical protein
MNTRTTSATPVPSADAGSTRRGLLLGACVAGGALELLRGAPIAEGADAAQPPPPSPRGEAPGPSCGCSPERGPMRVVGWAARRVAD